MSDKHVWKSLVQYLLYRHCHVIYFHRHSSYHHNILIVAWPHHSKSQNHILDPPPQWKYHFIWFLCNHHLSYVSYLSLNQALHCLLSTLTQ